MSNLGTLHLTTMTINQLFPNYHTTFSLVSSDLTTLMPTF